jgi:hypothetical protein
MISSAGALDSLGADVPGSDAALRIEHEDGVVMDALDEEAEALFALRALLLDHAARAVRRGDALLQSIAASHFARLAVRDLLLERPRGSPEQVRALRRDHGRMGAADFLDQASVARLVEAAHRVGAEEREPVEPGEVVPQLLQPNGRLLVSIAPKEIDHLSVDTHLRLAPALPALFDQAADDRAELLPVGLAADDELRKRVACIEQRQLPGDARAVQPAAAQPEPVDQRPFMRPGGDEDDRFSGGESGGGETGYGVVEHVLVMIKLNEMLMPFTRAAESLAAALPFEPDPLGVFFARLDQMKGRQFVAQWRVPITGAESTRPPSDLGLYAAQGNQP